MTDGPFLPTLMHAHGGGLAGMAVGSFFGAAWPGAVVGIVVAAAVSLWCRYKTPRN